MNNIKYGISCNGMVLTDMPIEMLKAMRDSIDDAIRKYEDSQKDKYITDIQAAIDAARDAGYEVFINEGLCRDETNIELYDEDEDEDENEGDDYSYGPHTCCKTCITKDCNNCYN